MPRLALATYAAFPDLPADDQILQQALVHRGVTARAVCWDAPVDWSDFDAVVVRSCWDYHLRHAEFLSWIERVERAGPVLHNAPSILRWNSDKHYLRDLERSGVDVVHTRWSDESPTAPLAAILTEEGWDEVVIKPAISASANDTWRIPAQEAADWEDRYRELTRRGPALIQPFVPEVSRDGEWSLVFIGGEFSHSMLKRPAPGDFRVQTEWGGTQERASADPAMVRVGRNVLRRAPGGPVPSYARVDGCVVGGRFRLMELELLEPTLYLTEAPQAAERLADLVLEGL